MSKEFTSGVYADLEKLVEKYEIGDEKIMVIAMFSDGSLALANAMNVAGTGGKSMAVSRGTTKRDAAVFAGMLDVQAEKLREAAGIKAGSTRVSKIQQN